jgi:hypothetical protein
LPSSQTWELQEKTYGHLAHHSCEFSLLVIVHKTVVSHIPKAVSHSHADETLTA